MYIFLGKKILNRYIECHKHLMVSLLFLISYTFFVYIYICVSCWDRKWLISIVGYYVTWITMDLLANTWTIISATITVVLHSFKINTKLNIYFFFIKRKIKQKNYHSIKFTDKVRSKWVIYFLCKISMGCVAFDI